MAEREPGDTSGRLLAERDLAKQGGDALTLTRRTAFSLGAGLAAGLLGVSGTPAQAAARADIRYVLTDRRHPESLEFGDALVREGAQRLEVVDGLTRLWQEALVPLWRGETGAIAGLTGFGTWTCLAEQARSCRRRSVLVARHGVTRQADGTEHALCAPAPLMVRATALENSGAAWPLVMARLAVHCPTNLRPAADQSFQDRSMPAAAPSAALVSWVIA